MRGDRRVIGVAALPVSEGQCGVVGKEYWQSLSIPGGPKSAQQLPNNPLKGYCCISCRANEW